VEINSNDPFVKKSFYADKKNRKEKINVKDSTGSKKTESTPQPHSREEIKELQDLAQKSILKSQTLIGGLENLRTLALSPDNADEKNRILQEIIGKTVFDNKPVLQEYEALLNTALINKNQASIDNLILAEKENIKNSSSKVQNLVSIDSTLHQEDAEALLQSVIRQLKESGEPQMNLTINKVLDLLKE